MIEVLPAHISPARRIAFEVLETVSKGAFASDALREHSSVLGVRDAGLASQIVFGCLRYQAQLDYLISLYSGREIGWLDNAVTIALRMAIFQLRYLDRIPAHAAVHESVEIVKGRKRSAAGFVNAILRRVNRSPVKWPRADIELSCPAWLLDRWAEHFGVKEARKIGEAALNEPPRYIRVPPGRGAPEAAVTSTSVQGCFRLLGETPEGIRLHDIGSQSIVPLLNLQAGQTFLDLCAAPGNKTLQALETPLGLAIACDISPNRTFEIPDICPRVVLDATRELPFSRAFDRILVDAPCSGTGTVGRNPEIKWRVQAKDFKAFQERQTRILLQAIRHLAPGGKLVYSTCSLEAEENEDVVRAALESSPRLRCDNEIWRLPGREEGDGFYAARLVADSRVTD
ncbi:MAG: antitermination protein NusB [Acidobacteriaceae bacterium]|nr:antitermination protein NusB [Acidobacteriaceae bacterium]MBV9780779.1 antitermination protein NusB [Acidobacteriaceae bacterium]